MEAPLCGEDTFRTVEMLIGVKRKFAEYADLLLMREEAREYRAEADKMERELAAQKAGRN